MKNLTNRIEVEGSMFNIIVSTKYGTTLESLDKDRIVFHTSILKSGLPDPINTRLEGDRRKNISSKKRRL